MSYNLICFSKNNTTLYKNELFENCDTSNHISNYKAEAPTLIYDSEKSVLKINDTHKFIYYSIQIIDQNGRNIFSNQFNKEKKEVSIPNLVSGLYFITLSNENNIYYKKLRIQ
jgi:uncharacterized membrane protein